MPTLTVYGVEQTSKVVGGRTTFVAPTALDAAIALRELLSNKVTAMSGASTDTEYPSAKTVYDAIQALNQTGQTIAPFGATFATLPPVPANTNGDTTRYNTVLTADDIGTGDAANPQYPKGIYLTGANQAAGWNFAVSLSTDILEGILADFDDPVESEVSKLWKGKTLDSRFLPYAADRTAAASVAAIADDAATVAEIALMNMIGEVPEPDVTLGRLAPVDKVVTGATLGPDTANARILWVGASTGTIWQYDNAGTNPQPVTTSGIGNILDLSLGGSSTTFSPNLIGWEATGQYTMRTKSVKGCNR